MESACYIVSKIPLLICDFIMKIYCRSKYFLSFGCEILLQLWNQHTQIQNTIPYPDREHCLATDSGDGRHGFWCLCMAGRELGAEELPDEQQCLKRFN
jgi:hypothetical protein